MFSPDHTGQCPHCRIAVRFEVLKNNYDKPVWGVPIIDGLGKVMAKTPQELYHISNINYCSCPNCKRAIITLNDKLIYPIGSSRPPCPKEVPNYIRKDYAEACLVESLSNNAAAALARRCLQNMLRDVGMKPSSLNNEIEEAMDSLPSHLSEAIDAIRNIGNFSAHPIKSETTGEIVNAEPGETEWVLDVLESLFDHYYVQPALLKEKKIS